MGTILNVSAQRMKGVKRKWFDFNLILKSYVVKKLLKSHVKNKLKNKEKRFLFLNVFLFLFIVFFFSFFFPSFYRKFSLSIAFTVYLFWETAAEFLIVFCPHILTYFIMPIPGLNLAQFTLDFIIYCNIAILVFPSSRNIN